MTKRTSISVLTLFYAIQCVIHLSETCFSSGVCNCMQHLGCGICSPQAPLSSPILSDCGGGCVGQPLSPYAAPFLPPPPLFPLPPPSSPQQSYVLTSGGTYRLNYFPSRQLPQMPLRFEYPQNTPPPPPPPLLPYAPPASKKSSHAEIVEQSIVVHPSLMEAIRPTNTNSDENYHENENWLVTTSTTTDYSDHAASTEKTHSGKSNHVDNDSYQLDNSAESVGGNEQRDMRITVIDKRLGIVDDRYTENGYSSSTLVGEQTKIDAVTSTVTKSSLISGRDNNENFEKNQKNHSNSLLYATSPPGKQGGERLSEYSRSENSYYALLESLATTSLRTVATEAAITVTPTISTTTITYNEQHLKTIDTEHPSNNVHKYDHRTSTVTPSIESSGHSLSDRWDSLPVVPPSAAAVADGSDSEASVDGVEYLAVIHNELQERRVDPYAIYYNQVCDGIAFGRSMENGTVAAAEKCSHVGCAALNIRAVGLDFEVVYLRVVNSRRPLTGFNCMSVLNVPSVLSYGGGGLNTLIGAQKRVSKFVGEIYL